MFKTTNPLVTRAMVVTLGGLLAQAVLLPAAIAATEPSSAALVMGPGRGLELGSWSDAGRASTDSGDGGYFGELRQLQALGDQLFVLGTVNEPDEGPGHSVIFASSDGASWLPAAVPASEPTFTSLASTASGLIAAGSVRVDGASVGKIWSTSDGVEWTEQSAPPVTSIDQIVSTEDPLAVVAGNWLWFSPDGETWTQGTKLVNMSIAHGPGGFVAWQGGGQDRMLPTVMIHSDDLTAWTEVGLPAALGKGKAAFGGIQVFPLEDQWVLIPSEAKLPDTIYTSADGVDWQEAPRPPRMMEGMVSWITQVGDQARAFGTLTDDDGSPTGLWSWQPGEPAADAVVLSDSGDEFIDAPVAWQDGYAATGLERNRDQYLDFWRMTMAAN